MKKITAFFLICSLGLIGIGLYNEQQLSVLNKAIKVCLECIGIG